LNARVAETDCHVTIPRALAQVIGSRGPMQPLLDERRQYVRFSCPAKILLEVGTTIKGIERESQFYAVLLTDLSRKGVEFLHPEQLFPGERPLLWFATGKQTCRVVRCLQHNKRCFEVGAIFDQGPQTVQWLREISAEMAFGCRTVEDG